MLRNVVLISTPLYGHPQPKPNHISVCLTVFYALTLPHRYDDLQMRTFSDELLSVAPVGSDCNPPWEGSNKAASLSVKPDWLMTSIRL